MQTPTREPDGSAETAIRRAHRGDVPIMAHLIACFAERNAVLPRSPSSIIGALRDFHVAELRRSVVGCGALSIIDDDLAEVRTLVVDEAAQGYGLGRRLVEACLADASAMGFTKVFALTRVPDFFTRLGFVETPMSALPQKVWLDCVHCPSFPDCDEIAMITDL